jgi:hypothetical protein
MLSLLIFLSRATFWNFTDSEFEAKKANSINLPLFVVCYSQWCPHCSGIAEGTLQYATGEGNRTDVLITMIDCSVQGHECGHFYIVGTPHMVLVMGPHRRYWPRVGSREAKEWNMFLDRYLNYSLREVHNESELHTAKREPYDGGTTFHLETPSRNTPLVDELRLLSREYRVYNDTFTFHVDESLRNPVLTAHTSPYCSVTWRSGTLRDFLEAHKFGSRHRYDLGEFWHISERSKTAMLLVEEGLSPGQSYALESLPRNYCDQVVFGYISVKEDKDILKEVHRDRLPLPALVHTDMSKCRTFYLGRTAEADSSAFLPMAVKGGLCDRMFAFGALEDEEWEEEMPDESGQPKGAAVLSRKIPGSKFVVCYLSVCLLILFVARLRVPAEEKQE